MTLSGRSYTHYALQAYYRQELVRVPATGLTDCKMTSTGRLPLKRRKRHRLSFSVGLTFICKKYSGVATLVTFPVKREFFLPDFFLVASHPASDLKGSVRCASSAFKVVPEFSVLNSEIIAAARFANVARG